MTTNKIPNNFVRKTIDTITIPLQAFAKLEASSGVFLLASALLAMIAANTQQLSSWYFNFINLPIEITVGSFQLKKSLLLLVNDGLMAIFFYIVGLEIKREMLFGELSSPKKASFSIFAAIGGMLIPALAYILINPSLPTNQGWGIPMATDIAFALGIVALLGKRVPITLKIFLLALAIVDDLGAISIIALFYSTNISTQFLGYASFSLFLLFILNYAGIRKLIIGLTLGFITWFCFLKSGVHATLAGVFLAFLTPTFPVTDEKSTNKEKNNLLDKYIHFLHPWSAFFIMPIFAFFNAGVKIVDSDVLSLITSPVSLGVMCGLVFGKPIGIFLFTFIPVKLGLTQLPKGTNWLQILSVAFIAGIGFTMSLFISSLAFTDTTYSMQAKIGILMASLTAAMIGLLTLWVSTRKQTR